MQENSKSSVIEDSAKVDLTIPYVIKPQEKKPDINSGASAGASDDDVQARYEALVKSGATAISSDMLFGEEAKATQAQGGQGRWSTPASLSALGEKL
jgi:hypothetical protein